jgi:glycosyltransferase involved in cell wall biosynthesis
VDDSVFHPMPRRQKYFSPQEHEQNTPKIVWHGKHARYNGPLRFIDLAKRMENAAARLCGDGPQRAEVEQALIQRHKKEWYVGPLPFEELGAFLSEGDFGMYPLREMAGVPMALVEAMAVGLPVITTSCGACSELIEHGRTGYICKNESEMLEIARKLTSDNSLRETIGRAAAKTVQQNWTLEAATRKLERELNEVLNRSSIGTA